MIDKVTVITPTGDRPECLELLRRWMANQTRQPDQWLIIDDGKIPVQNISEATVIHRLRQADDPVCTLGKNLEMAVQFIAHDKILIMEDDDWYGPDYIKTMAALLDNHELAGIWGTNYYAPRLPGYRKMGRNDHASLSQTAFRKSFLPKLLEATPGDCSVDFRIWFKRDTEGKYQEGQTTGHLVPGHGKYLHCSMKGMPGRSGAGCGHDNWGYIRDNDLDQLKRWCLDVDAYLPFVKKERLVIYTAIAGSGRDNLVDPVPVPGVDYVCFTDQPLTSKVWEIRPFKWRHTEDVRTAKYPKALPHLHFPDHDISVWVDGNIIPKTDIQKITHDYLKQHDFAVHHHPQRDCIYQEADVVLGFKQDHPHLVKDAIEKYQKANMPQHLGLTENGILFRRHHNDKVKEAMAAWWQEICEGTSSDQIPLAYVLWKTRLAVRWIEGNLRFHPSFDFRPHPTLYWGAKPGEHYSRRKPLPLHEVTL